MSTTLRDALARALNVLDAVGATDEANATRFAGRMKPNVGIEPPRSGRLE